MDDPTNLVRVKPLVWREMDGAYQVVSAMGTYSIKKYPYPQEHNPHCLFYVTFAGIWLADATDEAAAKAAAQAHYDAAVRALIELPPEVPDELTPPPPEGLLVGPDHPAVQAFSDRFDCQWSRKWKWNVAAGLSAALPHLVKEGAPGYAILSQSGAVAPSSGFAEGVLQPRDKETKE